MLKNIKVINDTTVKVELKRLESNFDGYNSLAQYQKQLHGLNFKNIIFDFSSSNFIEANLFAIIGALIPDRHNTTVGFEFSKFAGLFYNKQIENVIERNGFLGYYGKRDSYHSYNDTTIQYRIISRNEIEDFAIYVNKDVLKEGTSPKMSPGVRKKIIESIIEICNNSFTHGNISEPKVYACGQFFPNLGRIKITLVDLGISIRNNINRCFNLDFSGVDAIKWAIAENNTTRKGNTPGGLGLKLIRRFLNFNGGKIQIVSNDGFWEEDGNKENTRTLQNPFKGTIVTIVFNTNDSNTYV